MFSVRLLQNTHTHTKGFIELSFLDFEARPEPWEDNREGRNSGTVEVSKTKQKLTQVHLPHLQQVNILHEYAINKGSQASPALPWWPDCSMSSPVTIRAYWENSFRVIHIVRIIELLLNMWTCVFCNLLKICIYINHATDLLKAPESATANHYNIDPYEGVLLLVQKDWTDDALPRSIYASCNSHACCVEKNNNNNRWRKAAKAYPPTPLFECLYYLINIERWRWLCEILLTFTVLHISNHIILSRCVSPTDAIGKGTLSMSGGKVKVKKYNKCTQKGYAMVQQQMPSIANNI